MPIFVSAYSATLEAHDLIKSLHNTVPDVPFVTLNDTHHALLQSSAEIFNIIPKEVTEQIIDRHNECCSWMYQFPDGPNHVRVSGCYIGTPQGNVRKKHHL